MSVLRFKLIFFSPHQNTRQILNHLFKTLPQVVGKIGNYEQCAFVTRGTGQFKPEPGAQPAIGTLGELEYVEEDRVEVVVNDKGDREEVKRTIKELKAVHPYEEVAYDVYKLENFTIYPRSRNTNDSEYNCLESQDNDPNSLVNATSSDQARSSAILQSIWLARWREYTCLLNVFSIMSPLSPSVYPTRSMLFWRHFNTTKPGWQGSFREIEKVDFGALQRQRRLRRPLY